MREYKKSLLSMSKNLYKEKLVAGTSGNISIYDEDNDLMIITPTSTPYETMIEDDLVIMKLNGDIIKGYKKPSSEWRMHAKIYKERKDIKGIVHTHSPYATSFAVNHEEIPVILIEMIPFLGGSVEIAKFDMPGSEGLGDEALKVIKDKKACLLSNHGTLTVGKDVEDAFESSIYLEDVAKIYHLAKLNKNVKVIDPEIIKKMKG